MFIRSDRYTAKSGESRTGYRLVEGYYIDGKHTQHTLLDLGPEFALPKKDWPRVITLVRDYLQGQLNLDFEGESSLIRDTARDLIQRLQAISYRAKDVYDRYEQIEIQSINFPPNSVRTVGGERLALRVFEILEFEEVLLDLGFSSFAARLMEVCIVARMLKLKVRQSTLAWLREESAILELLDLEARPITAQKIKRASKRFWMFRRRIMRGLFARNPQLIGAVTDGVLYDLTHSCHIESRRSDTTHDQYREDSSKDHSVATLVMALSEKGYPTTCEVMYHRNFATDFLKRIPKKIRASGNPLIIDPDSVTETRLQRLTKAGIPWICVNFDSEDPDEMGVHDDSTWDWKNHVTEMRLYHRKVRHDTRVNAAIEAECAMFEQELITLHEGLGARYKPKRYEVIVNRIATLRARYGRVADQYDVHVSKKKGVNAVAISFIRQSHFREGQSSYRYKLRTNQMDWALGRTVRLYRQLRGNQDIFQALHDEVETLPSGKVGKLMGPRENFFISVLAFLGISLIKRTLEADDICIRWGALRNKLSQWGRVTTVLTGRGGQVYMDRQDTQIYHDLHRMATLMGVIPRSYHKRVVYRS